MNGRKLFTHVGYLGVAAPLARLCSKLSAPRSELHSSEHKYAAQGQSAAKGHCQTSAEQRRECSLNTGPAGSDSIPPITRPVKLLQQQNLYLHSTERCFVFIPQKCQGLVGRVSLPAQRGNTKGAMLVLTLTPSLRQACLLHSGPCSAQS